VTTQTIRNRIDGGTLSAAKIGHAFRVKREDVDELLARARADSASLTTRCDSYRRCISTRRAPRLSQRR
jgi:excisionase family DNA binding protein